MLLSDRDIKKEIKKGNIKIKPHPTFDIQLSSCSLDLRLGYEFRTFQYSVLPFIDIKKELPSELSKKIKISGDKFFIVQPGEFVLGTTYEWVELSDHIAARIEGRSSIGRLGIIVHATASLVDPGWKGNLVLELSNIARMPVALYPKMRICSLAFEYLSSPSEIPYNKRKISNYINQKGAVFSKINKAPL